VTTAVAESIDPMAFEMRDQYDAVEVSGGVVKVAAVASATGDAVDPLVPLYHWYESGPVPVAVTVNVARSPDATVTCCGCPLIVGVVPDGGAGSGADGGDGAGSGEVGATPCSDAGAGSGDVGAAPQAGASITLARATTHHRVAVNMRIAAV
jgi:hypothetical protein